MPRFLLLAVPLLLAADWPTVPKVEAQPLLAQARRVAQALEQLGQPLPADAAKAIAALKEADGDAAVSAAVQTRLDPLCLAAVTLAADGSAAAVASPGTKELVEQGWRVFLVKVLNPHGLTGGLRVDSPNARPVPNAPAESVESRWLSLTPFIGQPLLPRLGGLGLEYRMVLLSARDIGDRTADLVFSLAGGPPSKPVREWSFATNADGWTADNQCTAKTQGGRLHVVATGTDPYLSAPVTAAAGGCVLRFWAKFEKPGVGQVFWKTKDRPQFDGGHMATFPIESGRGAEYAVRFRADGELTGVRLDPGGEPGAITFDWISLTRETADGRPASVPVAFVARPAVPVTFQVAEFDGTPCTAGFLIRDSAGRVYPAQNKRLAPDFFFHPQVYRSTGETVRLPAGTYTVTCSRGPESVPETKTLTVGDRPTSFRYTVKRWIDPSTRGWWSGDHHIHAAGCAHYEKPTEGVHPPDMMRHILGEDLKVGCCLTWGPCFDYQKRFFTGKPDDQSRPPYILRYDVEVSGFGSHASGHLNLLRLKDQIYPGGDSKGHWPTLGMNTLRWAKKQGAVCGPAHSASGLTRFVGRVPGATDGPNGLPNYHVPAYDGIGANEFIVDVTHEVPGADEKPVPAVDFISTMDTDRTAEFNMWYHVLNCGYRCRASGETDFPCISGDRVGMGRVYVKQVGKQPEFDGWVQGIADGCSYVSDGRVHLMDFTATAGGKAHELGLNGSELRLDAAGKVTFTVDAAVYAPGQPRVPVELVVNGLTVQTKPITPDGSVQPLTFEAEVSKSSWVAVRVFPGGHTNPFFVVVGGKPIRANKQSAEWCLLGVDQCWTTKQRTYRPAEQEQAKADYEHARQAYRRIIAECDN